MNIIFDCIETLPYNVKASLDERGQELWMNAFNKTVRKSKSKKEFRDASHDAWQMLKNYPGCRFFSGFVSTEDLDKQNDIVEVKKAFERISSHIDRGGTMVDTHTNRTCGAFVHVEMGKTRTGKEGVIAHSVIFQGEPYYDTVWEQIKKGIDCPTCRDVRKGFSIGGFALETRNACDASGCHRDILDMSIHEISICQDPANPEALVQEVNMMAKSENEMSKKDDEISKVLREDAVSTAEPAAPVAAVPQAPAAPSADPAAEAGKAQVPGQDVSQLDAKTVSTWLKNKHKENEEYQKLLIQLNGLTNPANISGVGVAKACNTSGVSLDEDVHTSICDNKCPENKEVEGDVHDPQVKDTMKFFENKKIEAEPAAKKDHGELMPGKDLKEIKFETTKVGPVVETKVMEGYGKLEPKNASSDMFEIPRGHLENDSEEAEEIEENVEDIEEEADDIEEIAEDIIEEDSEELEKAEDKKHSNCDCQTAEKFKSKFKPNGGASETIKDAGSKEEKNFGKEGKKVMMNGMDKAEIPDDLMPLFKEFLQEKGIKMEPEVQNEAIESPIEKAIYVDEDISEIDLKELANRQSFDSATILGKVATQKLRLHNSTTRMRLAKSLKVADIEYLTSSLEKDFAKNIKKKTIKPINKGAEMAAAGPVGMIAEEGKKIMQAPMKAAQAVVGHIGQVVGNKTPQAPAAVSLSKPKVQAAAPTAPKAPAAPSTPAAAPVAPKAPVAPGFAGNTIAEQAAANANKNKMAAEPLTSEELSAQAAMAPSGMSKAYRKYKAFKYKK